MNIKTLGLAACVAAVAMTGCSQEDVEDAKQSMQDAAAAVEETASKAADSAGEMADDAADSMHAMADDAADAASDAYNATADSAADAYDATADAASDAYDAAADAASDAADAASDAMDPRLTQPRMRWTLPAMPWTTLRVRSTMRPMRPRSRWKADSCARQLRLRGAVDCIHPDQSNSGWRPVNAAARTPLDVLPVGHRVQSCWRPI